MAYTMTEKKVLRKLGISDFKHMTKDKVIKFATMLPYMDPEVAKKALEQFPAFKDLATELVTQYKNAVDKAYESNNKSQDAFFAACNRIIDSLHKELEDDNIDSEERSRIEDKMIDVAAMIGEKDSENKNFIMKIIGAGALVVALVGGTAAAILGANSNASSSDDDDKNNKA
ncbi:MAG: hypothetical protein J6O61_06765 [Butyrivibrio sp.]|uniref:hypothetical protein n=1 Tax=Butyrivibrio sp. TaxID=28121 RepID=UPI001AFCFF08|nr:hypothetical protein [Butyrivibrio sp.]MBO6240531.1 hypothetical protein [Butyrivibrio sp.]